MRSGEAGGEERGVWLRFQLRDGSDGTPGSARFQAFGCPVAIACGSWLAQWAPGQTPAALAELGPERLCQALDLDPEDAPTAALAVQALHRALGAPVRS